MIYVFKTSVKSQEDIQKLRITLNEMLPQAKWNFDLDDCDNIFRVDTSIEDPGLIISVLQYNGFEAEELPY